MSEKFKSREDEVLVFLRALPTLRQSFQEILEISDAPEASKEKVRPILSRFFENIMSQIERQEDIYEIVLNVSGELIDALHVVNKPKDSPDNYLFVALRDALREQAFKAKGWSWPPKPLGD